MGIDNFEIDFLTIDQTGQKRLYQVVWDLEAPKTKERELRALNAAENELGIKGMLIEPIGYLKAMHSQASHFQYFHPTGHV